MLHNDDEQFGQIVRSLRERHGLSQQDLADKLHLTQPIVSRIEIGRQSVTIPRAKAIATQFELSLEELCAIAFGDGEVKE